MIGPFFAGFFSDVHILPIFSNSLPFYLAIVLTILNIVWLMWAFRETYIPVVKKELSITATLKSFKVAITSKNLLLMSIVFLCMQLSWSFYSQASPAYLQAVFHCSNFMLGVFSASLGVFIAIGGPLGHTSVCKMGYSEVWRLNCFCFDDDWNFDRNCLQFTVDVLDWIDRQYDWSRPGFFFHHYSIFQPGR